MAGNYKNKTKQNKQKTSEIPFLLKSRLGKAKAMVGGEGMENKGPQPGIPGPGSSPTPLPSDPVEEFAKAPIQKPKGFQLKSAF